jgi:hypothetical protein
MQLLATRALTYSRRFPLLFLVRLFARVTCLALLCFALTGTASELGTAVANTLEGMSSSE